MFYDKLMDILVNLHRKLNYFVTKPKSYWVFEWKYFAVAFILITLCDHQPDTIVDVHGKQLNVNECKY